MATLVRKALEIEAAEFDVKKVASTGLNISADELSAVEEEALWGKIEKPRRKLFGFGMPWARAVFCLFDRSALIPATVQWPTLLSGSQLISLSEGKLLAELSVFFEIAERETDASTLLYSLQVRDPVRWQPSSDFLSLLPSSNI